MPAAPKPVDEELRVEALQGYDILDTLPEKEYDQITELAANICDSPISLVSLVDVNRQWFKSKIGLDASATSRDLAFCAHAILDPSSPLVVEDATKDERFSDNELVTGPLNIRFYIGIPLNSPSGLSLGTLCVIDQKPREVTPQQIKALTILSDNVVSLLELRKSKLQQNKLIEQLHSSNAELERFAYIGSHDLQEPIRMISSFVSLLRKRYFNDMDAGADKYIDFIVEVCTRMQDQVNGLLSLSRIEANDEQSENVNCHEVLEDVMLDLAIKVQERNAHVSWGSMPAITMVPSQLKIVFQNIIINALKYNDETEPKIEINAEMSCDHVRFSIQDNGIGIEEMYQEKIFELFKRLNGRNEFSGTGIGLTITKKIIERHGGNVTLESVPGVGSTFYFTVPVGKSKPSFVAYKIAK